MGVCVNGSTGRNQSLDILRGIAILLVLGFHYAYFFFWARIGWIGVDLFFVLSGFLISGLLFNEYKKYGCVKVGRFWIRRGFKIYPPFYVFMAVTAIIFLTAGTRTIDRDILSDLFFLQNYLPHVWDHGWSLAVEEHFYLLLPILLLLMIRSSKNKADPFRSIPYIFIALSVFCLALRIATLRITGAPSPAVSAPTHLRMDSLFAGVTLGYYNHFHPDLFKRLSQPSLLPPGLLFVSPSFLFGVNTVFMTTIGFTMLFIGFGHILMSMVNRKPSRNLIARLLARIGYHSYSIYLWHAPLAFLVFRNSPHLVYFLVYLAVCVVLGVVMSKLIERPSLALRDKLFPSRIC
jgi:peptidoglycan/LPS O-acetylase OafA/YrhL